MSAMNQTVRVEKPLVLPKECYLVEMSQFDAFKKAYREAAIELGIPNIQATVEIFGREWDCLVTQREIKNEELSLVRGKLASTKRINLCDCVKTLY